MSPRGRDSDRLARLEAKVTGESRRTTREVDLSNDIHDQLASSIDKLTRIVEAQEKRTRTLELTIARGFGALGVIVIVSQVVVPLLFQIVTGAQP